MSEAPAIVWFRQDLRLSDNPALSAAIESKRPLVLCYVLDDAAAGSWRMGGASRWWLHRSLAALSEEIARRGARLILRKGAAESAIPTLAAETGAAAIHWNRTYEPFAIARDKALKQMLSTRGCEPHSFNGALLNEPWQIKNKSGEPFKVFTPFWRACLANAPTRTPAPAPSKLRPYAAALGSDNLDQWRLAPRKPNWAAGFEPLWTPGEAGAKATLASFIDAKLECYAEARDLMGRDGTSRLSPHLHFGELSPTQAQYAVEAAVAARPELRRPADKFLSELGWREFSHHLLFHWPTLPEVNWRAQFDAFPWRDDPSALQAWQSGRTGYPVVDAAMRELWATGYMHNRARMIVASFLIKHLLIDWRRGEEWFWDTLVDADLANNAASWQWVAGSGADASPYFRIFNPVTQGERYDSDGSYVRRWLPELARLSNSFIHRPWEANKAELDSAGVKLGADYPHPIVNHAAARARALEAFATL